MRSQVSFKGVPVNGPQSSPVEYDSTLFAGAPRPSLPVSGWWPLVAVVTTSVLYILDYLAAGSTPFPRTRQDAGPVPSALHPFVNPTRQLDVCCHQLTTLNPLPLPFISNSQRFRFNAAEWIRFGHWYKNHDRKARGVPRHNSALPVNPESPSSVDHGGSLFLSALRNSGAPHSRMDLHIVSETSPLALPLV